MKNKSGLFKNTVILFTAMFITKIIGAMLKIPLTNLIGGTGMGYFSAAYSFFTPVYTVLSAGIPIVITRMTAQSISCGRYRQARSIKSAALFLSLILGILGTVFMLVLAEPFSKYAAGSPESLLSVLAISPSVVFCCLAAAYKGYYEGLSNMVPTAVSQVLESVVKVIMGLGLSETVIYLGSRELIPAEKVIPYCSAAAVLGVTIGELCGTLFLMLRSRLKSDQITEEELKESPLPEKRSAILKRILLQALPISTGAVIINLGSFVDLLTIPSGIQECFAKNTQYFNLLYKDALEASGTQSFGSFVYGSYSGIVLSVFMLITSLTALIGKSALPSIAAASEKGDKTGIKRNISILLSGIFVIGLPLCLTLGGLAEPALRLLYPSRAAEVSVSVYPLVILCAGGLPIALCSGLFSVFQAVGRFDLPIKLMMCGSAAKLILNLILIRIPQLSLVGASMSTVLSHVLVMILGFISLRGALEIKINPFRLFVKPFAAALACAFLSVLSYYLFFNNYAKAVCLALSVCAGGLVYIVLLLMLDKRILEELRHHGKKQHVGAD